MVKQSAAASQMERDDISASIQGNYGSDSEQPCSHLYICSFPSSPFHPNLSVHQFGLSYGVARLEILLIAF